jgi:Trk K+ transport system NAD-binding subunit
MIEQPIILCGLGRIGWRVLDYLQAAGLPVVIVDTRCAADDPRLRGARLVKGDCRKQEVLEEAGVPQCRGVLIMTNDDLVNISTALMVRHLHPEVRIVMRLFNQNLVNRLGKAFHNIFALSTSTLAAPLFALSALTGQALGSIRLEGVRDGMRQVAELTIVAGSELIGAPISEVVNRYKLLVLAHLRPGEKERLLLDVDLQDRLLADDRLILCGEPRVLAGLLNGDDPELVPVRWAGWLRRMGRVAWRTLADVELPVKVCAGVLLAVIVISTLILHLELDNHPLHKAFYHTISLMATAADMHADDPRARWFSVFASVMRLMGAALIAAFTAILTNYLLRARLAGALEFRRIPDGGHVIVCGLGNIGFRVVEELVRFKERVVVIEQSKDSRFVTTTRRLGVPVLIGDATIPLVLQQAHAAQARAVIAATSDDLINLEVALMVRELKANQRVVLHLSDPQLAGMLRENANIRLALSIPLLAAPAFVAALFGDRVQNVFMIDGRMLATLDLVIPAQDDRLCGQMVRNVAADYRLVPVAVFDVTGKAQPQPLDVRLEAGQRLVAISKLPDLERLLRREAVKRDLTPAEASSLNLA